MLKIFKKKANKNINIKIKIKQIDLKFFWQFQIKNYGLMESRILYNGQFTVRIIIGHLCDACGTILLQTGNS